MTLTHLECLPALMVFLSFLCPVILLIIWCVCFDCSARLMAFKAFSQEVFIFDATSSARSVRKEIRRSAATFLIFFHSFRAFRRFLME
jgi:hypothetical protein